MDSLIKESKVLNIDKSNWQLTKLGDLLNDISSRVDNPRQSGYDRFVGLEHFVSGDIKIRNWGSTENLTSSTKAFKAGDILFARRNAYLRRSSLVDFDGCCSGDAFVLRENLDRVEPGFLAFLMNSNAMWDFANENAAGTMSKRVKWRDLANYEFLLPPKDQQAKLAELLWAMDKVLEKEKKLLENNSNYFETCRNAIFSTEPSPHDLNILRDSSIEENHLESYYNVKSLNGIYKAKEFQGKGVRLINMGELFAYPIIRDEEMSLIELSPKETKQYVVEEGDLIFARRSLVIEGAGKCSIIGEHNNPMTFESSMIRIRLNKKVINPKFVFHFLKSNEGRKRIRRIVGFTTVAGITSTDLAKVKVPNVAFKKQIQILELLDKFDQIFLDIHGKIVSSKALQKSLINQIF